MPASTIPTLLIFVVAPLVIWWLRRSRIAVTGGLRVTSRTGLTRNGVVAVVEADGRRFLVGATDHGISLLTELGHPDGEPTVEESEPGLDLVPGTGPGTSPIDALRNMTVRKPTRPRIQRANHRP
jgi:flagellar biogenesis protein FliO